ncbi:hypothetical protein LIER_41899 [Lithospermum erythrorhizon]|uniref:DUF4283 domain-containing protein n=1 Tax=Lithospermum erythrorhizon TaxID=34254 RepID=A0AAV3RHL9_LITER
MGNNLFHFIFDDATQMTRVLQGEPWLFEGYGIFLGPWKEGIQGDQVQLNRLPCWIGVVHGKRHNHSRRREFKRDPDVRQHEGMGESLAPRWREEERRTMHEEGQPIVRELEGRVGERGSMIRRGDIRGHEDERKVQVGESRGVLSIIRGVDCTCKKPTQGRGELEIRRGCNEDRNEEEGEGYGYQ